MPTVSWKSKHILSQAPKLGSGCAYLCNHRAPLLQQPGTASGGPFRQCNWLQASPEPLLRITEDRLAKRAQLVLLHGDSDSQAEKVGRQANLTSQADRLRSDPDNEPLPCRASLRLARAVLRALQGVGPEHSVDFDLQPRTSELDAKIAVRHSPPGGTAGTL